jgi:F0F1-type ATP synthase membrane subunit c/vacuolar-type H+-ATPase subunit K
MPSYISKRILFVVLITGILLTLSHSITFAQSANDSTDQSPGTLGVAQMISINTKNIKDGTLISNSTKGNILTDTPYNSQIIGVISRDAAIILNPKNLDKGVPVISNGTVYVLVSSIGGAIKKGDLLTSSTLPGVAMKANDAGYVIGTAMEDYNNPNKKQTDLIAVNMYLHYFNSKPVFPGSLTDIFKLALLPTKDSPSAIFKYVVAALVALGSFVLAFITFGRTAAKGVEALGRNPSASKTIHLGIIFNVTIVGIIVLAGIGVAFLILRL